MNTVQKSILERGYATVESSIDTETRQSLLSLGNEVIDLALRENSIREALTYSPFPSIPGKDVCGFFVDEPRVAKDDSISFHSGWQSAEIARSKLGDKMPQVLVDFFEVQQTVLRATVDQWSLFLDSLLPAKESSELKGLLFHTDTNLNNHHIRIVRYNDVLENPPKEVFSTHGDLSVLTTELAESIDRVNNMAPYPLELVSDSVDIERYRKSIAIKDNASPIDYNPETEVVTFLGFAAAYVRSIRNSDQFKQLRAGFHYGKFNTTQPKMPKGYQFGNHRLAAIAFAHPHYEVPYTEYRSATTEACRPEQVFEKQTKN